MVNKGIVIVTHESNRPFLDDCLKSCLQDKYPILVVNNLGKIIDKGIPGVEYVNLNWNGFELGGILAGMDRFDEFILLQDTVVIKDQRMFDIAFDHKGSVGFSQDLAYHYCAKFKTDILKRLEVPKVSDRKEAISWEWKFGRAYKEADPDYIELEPLGAGDHSIPQIERHGHKGILLVNNYMEKFKRNY